MRDGANATVMPGRTRVAVQPLAGRRRSNVTRDEAVLDRTQRLDEQAVRVDEVARHSEAYLRRERPAERHAGARRDRLDHADDECGTSARAAVETAARCEPDRQASLRPAWKVAPWAIAWARYDRVPVRLPSGSKSGPSIHSYPTAVKTRETSTRTDPGRSATERRRVSASSRRGTKSSTGSARADAIIAAIPIITASALSDMFAS